MATAPEEHRGEEPVWPGTDDRRVVFLLDVAGRLEERLLRGWIERHRPGTSACDVVRIPCSRRRGSRRLDPALEALLAEGDDPLLAPLRVAFLAKARDGHRSVRPSDVLTWGDPRDPDPLRARWIVWRRPDRVRIVAGEPAPASELAQRWRAQSASDAGATTGLAGFVARQAVLALDRAERRLRGNRYKVPRFVAEDLLARPAFRGTVARLARELGEDEARIARRAQRCLREIAATHSPFVIDLVIQLWKAMIGRGYDLHWDAERLEGVRALAQQHPVVFLPTHKSNLDHPGLQTVLHENGFPPNHTAGGINMNFFPIGPLVRRSGVFFIRRSFKDDAVYKAVLQHYLDYLLEKRFPLEWYIEGGRSRSGKLLPPRFGLLAYVVDAYRRGKSDDVYLLPVSVAYDQISDVGDYAAEQRGGGKERESLGWFLRVVRRLRRRYGRILISFGEPLSLHKSLGPPDPEARPDPDETSLELQKIAFEVCVRINATTPVTPIALVCLALLGRGDRALTAAQTASALANLVAYVRRRRLPGHEELDLDDEAGVVRILDLLAESRVLVRHEDGPETVYAIGPDKHLAAAYYRNNIVHYFVTGAIAELALLKALGDVEDRREAFWEETLALRDLLKFEFFFSEKEAFRAEIDAELRLHHARWERRFEYGPEALQNLLTRIRPFHSHRVLRPFLEAYRVVGDALERLEPGEAVGEPEFLRRCLALGQQYLYQKHLSHAESVSQVLFATALKLARHRELTDPDGSDLAARRAAFAEEIRDATRRIDAVEAMVRARHAGLLR